MKENKKKNFFKSKLFLFAILPVFALGLVFAGVMAYYGQVKTTVNVEQPIVFTVNGAVFTGQQATEDVNCDAGETCIGPNPYRITNNGEFDKEISLVTSGNTNGVDVEFVGKLELTTKNTCNDPENPICWQPTEDKEATVIYTLVGEDFNTEVELESGEVLVYALDHDDRFTNYASVIKVEDIDSDLPLSSDWNADADPDYCDLNNGFDSYEHCNGAKLWIVKESDLGEAVDGVYPLSWANMNEYLYETDLIRYFNNADGEIVVPAGSFVEFYPQFSVDEMATDGNYVIYTTVDEVTA